LAGGYENANDDTGAEVVVGGDVEEADREEEDEEVADEDAGADEEEAFAMTEETKLPKADIEEEDSVGRERALLTTR
jgi:hypothetical protein